MVERLLEGPRTTALRLAFGDLQVSVGPAPQGGYLLEVRRPAGRVGEREAVDIAVMLHRLIDRAGASIEPEMLSYRGRDRSRCFVLGIREWATA
jgi:hypothetical protein